MTRAAPALLLAGLLCGCAALQGEHEPGADTAAPAASAASSPARAPYRVEVIAPEQLRALLTDYLDLARFQNAPDTEAIDAGELARLAAAAPAQARTLLETEGYFAAQVQATRLTGSDGQPVVRVLVDPGPRSVITQVDFTVDGELQTLADKLDEDAAALRTSLRRGWPLRPGEPFRQAAWASAKTGTLAQARAEGYPAAAWTQTQAQVDAEQHQVALTLALDSGALYRLGEIRVEGLERYDESTVRRLSTFAAGQPYNEKLLLDYQERIQKLGLFDSATVELDPDPKTSAAAPVRVRVHELTSQQATVGVGISANTGPRVTLEHRHRRPFGMNWVATNKFEFGSLIKSWTGELISHPLEGLYRNLLAGNAERLRSGEEIRTSWTARLGRTQDTQRIERTYFAELTHARVDNPAGRTRSEALTANYHWIYRDLDSILLPTDGYTVSLQSAAGRSRNSTLDNGPFGRGYGRYTLYRPLGRAWYASLRLEAGQIIASDAVGVPDTLLFRAGGDDSVRGYAYRTLGPLVDGVVSSGRVMATGSAEIARPISDSMPSLWWAVFADAGNAANHWKDLAPAWGYGLGLRWRSPVGPLRVDLAYGEEVRKVRLHLSVGIAF
ncbi:MAG: outer membrane protein assembly factor [Piscinibacter sp.]|uniref:autotransporter assembly complex protein TamA n=2 Tax=Piscinibacter sp. TaxID=1903157 RepID=UPI001B559057|nr:autotransporter assembly complex family protein [Piscinibacter sp.]MBP5992236.1 outer membrane protein assembly factor [Piscinibacter sp.]MBP6028175.1 outer membrane protein assembly factor [Piscinibacter sp.]